MKNHLGFSVMLLVMSVWQIFADDLRTNEWGSVNCNTQMSIALKNLKEGIHANQPVNLVIRIKNVSTNDTISVYHSPAIVHNSLVNRFLYNGGTWTTLDNGAYGTQINGISANCIVGTFLNSSGTWNGFLGVLSGIPAMLQPSKFTTNGLTFSWAAAQGTIYQLQYTTNLCQGNWVNIGSAITGSNAFVSSTNTLGSDQQPFYRVQQQ